MLNLVVLEGEGATNNIRQRTAREPIVQVEDENHKPVAGAIVVFTLPSNGAGGTFANGARTLTMVSDSKGQAVARGFRPNGSQRSIPNSCQRIVPGPDAHRSRSHQTNAVLSRVRRRRRRRSLRQADRGDRGGRRRWRRRSLLRHA